MPDPQRIKVLLYWGAGTKYIQLYSLGYITPYMRKQIFFKIFIASSYTSIMFTT